jgi:hypothetical protein
MRKTGLGPEQEAPFSMKGWEQKDFQLITNFRRMKAASHAPLFQAGILLKMLPKESIRAAIPRCMTIFIPMCPKELKFWRSLSAAPERYFS